MDAAAKPSTPASFLVSTSNAIAQPPDFFMYSSFLLLTVFDLP
jgi:hypothetical protein